MIHIYLYLIAIMANWVKRYKYEYNDRDWKTTVKLYLQKLCGIHFFHSKFLKQHLALSISTKRYVFDVLKHWSDVPKLQNSVDVVLEQPCRHNSSPLKS